MIKFEVGQTYVFFPWCEDREFAGEYKCIDRTEKTVTFIGHSAFHHGEVIKKRIDKYSRATETVYPLGKYSYAPMLDALWTKDYADKARAISAACTAGFEDLKAAIAISRA